MLLLEPLHTKFHPRPTYQESNQQRIEQITSIRISALVSVVLVNDAALVLLSSSMSIIVRWLRKRCQSSDGLSYRFAAAAVAAVIAHPRRFGIPITTKMTIIQIRHPCGAAAAAATMSLAVDVPLFWIRGRSSTHAAPVQQQQSRNSSNDNTFNYGCSNERNEEIVEEENEEEERKERRPTVCASIHSIIQCVQFDTDTSTEYITNG